MDYNKIIAVTGLNGLFELIISKSDGAVIKSLEDKSTKFVSSRLHSFTQLETVEVFTVKDSLNLSELFIAMQKSKIKMPDVKADNKTIKDYFEKINPDLDFEKVYVSDMKKMLKWLGILDKNKIEINSKLSEDGAEATDNVATSKPMHKETTHVKPQKAAPRKIESRGVK